MKSNFSMKDCKFFVDEKKRTIVCVLENTDKLFYSFINEKLSFYSKYFFIDPKKNKKFFNKIHMPNRFIGIAKCAPEDTWNETLGREIAYMKMREKVFNSFFNHASAYVDMIDEYINQDIFIINEFGVKLEKEFNKRKEYITKAINHGLSEKL